VKRMRDQHALIERQQARHLGFSTRQIRARVAAGELQECHPGVYRSAASPVTFEQRLMAACLAAGPQAAVSHAAAAWLWGLLPRPPDHPSVTVPPHLRPRLKAVEVHRLTDLDPVRISYRHSIPCTDPLRTLVDLAAAADAETINAAIDRALSTRLVSGKALDAELGRRGARGRRGVRPLREALTDRGIVGAPRPSVLEWETVRLLDRWGVPIHGREIKAGPDDRYRLDFMLVYPVTMEVDGYTYHWSPESKTYDEARRNRLRIDGLFLLVYTWRDVRADQRRMYQEVMTALARYARRAG